MAVMVPSLWHRRIQQLANMLRNKSMLLKQEYYCFYYVFISYFKARCIVYAPSCLSVCGLRGAESIMLSAGGAVTIILSVGGTERMIV
jgi:hypothetical protein